MQTQRPMSYVLTALLVLPAAANAVTPSSSQVRNFGSRWSEGSAHHTKTNKKGSRRQLSADDQLDILKLGFISTSKSRDGTCRHKDGVINFNRGGSLDDANKTEPRCRQLTVEDQLDILKLGFIPSCKSKHSPNPNNAMTNFNRGGSMDVTKPKHACHHLAFASIMAFLAGYADVICLKKFNSYLAMMSGNMVLLSVALAERKWKTMLWRLSLIGSYFAGAAGVRSIELLHRHRTESELSSTTQKPNQHLKIIAPIAAAVFIIGDKLIRTSPITNGHNWNFTVLALGFGMVYASMNQALNATITQLLTGHVVKLGSAISDRFLGGENRWNKASLTSVCLIGSFIVGGALGTLVLPLTPKDFPIFSLLGIVYALVLAMF